jgi:hypothetical protein
MQFPGVDLLEGNKSDDKSLRLFEPAKQAAGNSHARERVGQRAEIYRAPQARHSCVGSASLAAIGYERSPP